MQRPPVAPARGVIVKFRLSSKIRVEVSLPPRTPPIRQLPILSHLLNNSQTKSFGFLKILSWKCYIAISSNLCILETVG